MRGKVGCSEVGRGQICHKHVQAWKCPPLMVLSSASIHHRPYMMVYGSACWTVDSAESVFSGHDAVGQFDAPGGRNEEPLALRAHRKYIQQLTKPSYMSRKRRHSIWAADCSAVELQDTYVEKTTVRIPRESSAEKDYILPCCLLGSFCIWYDDGQYQDVLRWEVSDDGPFGKSVLRARRVP